MHKRTDRKKKCELCGIPIPQRYPRRNWYRKHKIGLKKRYSLELCRDCWSSPQGRLLGRTIIQETREK